MIVRNHEGTIDVLESVILTKAALKVFWHFQGCFVIDYTVLW